MLVSRGPSYLKRAAQPGHEWTEYRGEAGCDDPLYELAQEPLTWDLHERDVAWRERGRCEAGEVGGTCMLSMREER